MKRFNRMANQIDSLQRIKIDQTDTKILEILQTGSNITNAQLAADVGISPSAMLERVKRLEKSGIIDKYVALVDHKRAGMDVMALVSVSLTIHEMQFLEDFAKRIDEFDEVLECYHIAGEEDFLLKVLVKNMDDYRDFVVDKLTNVTGVNKIKTTFVLSTIKYNTRVRIAR